MLKKMMYVVVLISIAQFCTAATSPKVTQQISGTIISPVFSPGMRPISHTINSDSPLGTSLIGLIISNADVRPINYFTIEEDRIIEDGSIRIYSTTDPSQVRLDITANPECCPEFYDGSRGWGAQTGSLLGLCASYNS